MGQFYRRADVDALKHCARLPGSAARAWHVLLAMADHENGEVRISGKAGADLVGCSRNTWRNAVRLLASEGLIDHLEAGGGAVAEDGGAGTNRLPAYRISANHWHLTAVGKSVEKMGKTEGGGSIAGRGGGTKTAPRNKTRTSAVIEAGEQLTEAMGGGEPACNIVLSLLEREHCSEGAPPDGGEPTNGRHGGQGEAERRPEPPTDESGRPAAPAQEASRQPSDEPFGWKNRPPPKQNPNRKSREYAPPGGRSSRPKPSAPPATVSQTPRSGEGATGGPGLFGELLDETMQAARKDTHYAESMEGTPDHKRNRVSWLVRLGVKRQTAVYLAGRFGMARIREVVAAAESRAGSLRGGKFSTKKTALPAFVVAALRKGWTFPAKRRGP